MASISGTYRTMLRAARSVRALPKSRARPRARDKAATRATHHHRVAALSSALLAQFPDYNIRTYVRRRVQDGFRAGAGVTDAAEVAALRADADASLALIQRQSAVYAMYGGRATVMEGATN